VLKFERALPGEIGQIHLTLNMEERCRVIEKLGGKFYTNRRTGRPLYSLQESVTINVVILITSNALN